VRQHRFGAVFDRFGPFMPLSESANMLSLKDFRASRSSNTDKNGENGGSCNPVRSAGDDTRFIQGPPAFLGVEGTEKHGQFPHERS
jgi:hypothetical protein